MRNAPAASCAKVESTRVVTTGTSKRSDIPCAMVLRLIRGLPGVPGFLATVADRSSSIDLIPASGDQDPTISSSAPAALVSHRLRVHRIPPPTFVTIGRSAPPERAGCGEISIYFGKMEEKFWSKRGRACSSRWTFSRNRFFRAADSTARRGRFALDDGLR